ncbi:MAG: FixH family protein [Planctomycetota bacterium]
MTKSTSSKPTSTKGRVRWPLIVVALLGGHATLIITAVTFAVGGSGRGVVSDYYTKAVDFDQHKAELAASAELGWTIQLTPGSLVDDRGQRLITATLSDRSGQLISDATIHLRLTRLADGHLVETQFVPNADRLGAYQIAADCPAPGWYQADLVVERDGQRFIQQQEIQTRGGVALFTEDGV